MKRFFKSGYNYIQDMALEPGTYTFWAYIKSEFGDTFTFALANEANEWEVFDVDVEMGKLTKAYEVFTITEKKVKLDLINRYFDSEQPVYVYKPQIIKGNIPSDAGASPFDIDSIVDDLHDSIKGISDFTNEEFADRVLSASERVSLKRDMEAVETIFQSLKGSYEKLIINPFVPEAVITDLTAKYNAVASAKTNLFNVLNLIIAGDNIVTPEEITAKDDALLALNTSLYNYNLAEKEIQNALGEDYTQKISAIRDFTDNEFADRMLSETEKVSLSHDLDSVQSVIDSATSRFNEMLENQFLTQADRDLLIEKYNALLDAWDWDEDIDPSKPNGLKTVILNIINDPNNIIDPAEMLEKDAALSAFNIALGMFSETEVYVTKVTVEHAIEQATFWSLHATSPVIYKDSKDAVTDGYHMPITVKGQLHRGTQIQDGGFITVTANDETEAAEASPSPVLISPLDYDDKSLYTVRLYDTAEKTTLLDTMSIPVVFRGANGKDAINVTLSNEIDSVPASNDGVVSSYDNTGTDIRVFEGATELTYDGSGTSPGTFKVTSLGIDLTVGQISSPTAGILKCVVGNISNLAADKGITQFTITGKTMNGDPFTSPKEQRITKGKMGDPGQPGEDGDGITSTTIEYAKSSNGTTPPSTGWSTSLPTPTQGWYLWVRTTTTYKVAAATVTYSVSHWGEDGAGVLSVVDWYAISTNGITPPSTGWQSGTVPSKPANYYLWNYEVITYTDGRTQTQTAKRVIQGKDAKSISSITNAYAYSSSDTVSPTGGWQSSLSALGTKTAGYFLWVRDDITFTDGTSTATIGYVVRDGEPGDPGSPGQPGKGVSSVVIWYYKSSSSTQLQGGSWSTTKPSYSTSFFLWTKVITTYTDNSASETSPILDPDWHKVQAITDKFGTTTEGGLIQTVMMLLRELNSLQETAGISGIQGALKNNPAFWAGGTYAQAFALIEFLSKMSAGTAPTSGEYDNLAKITMLHNGAAKIGDFIIESNGRITMVDPATGKVRLAFNVTNIPTVNDILSTTQYGQTVTNAGAMGSTTGTTTLPYGISVTQNSSNLSFIGTLSIDAELDEAHGYTSGNAEVSVDLYKDGIFYAGLGSIGGALDTEHPTTSGTHTLNTTLVVPIGNYTIRVQRTFVKTITASGGIAGSSTFSWSFIKDIRRFEFGINGFMAWYTNEHMHFTEGGGLDGQAPANKWNAPGVLLSASVGASGGWQDVWGAKQSTTPPPAPSPTGRYTIYHTIGHTKYQVSCISNTASRSFSIYAKNTNNVIIECRTIGNTPALVNSAFDIVLNGNNYNT